MIEFEDELESLEDQIAEESDEFDEQEPDSFDDLESDQWSARFGESYIEDPFDADELDDQELERMEEDFFRDGSGRRSTFGSLDELEDE